MDCGNMWVEKQYSLKDELVPNNNPSLPKMENTKINNQFITDEMYKLLGLVFSGASILLTIWTLNKRRK